jgi:hypothetical protein
MQTTCTICGIEDDPKKYIDSPITKIMVEKQCCFHCAYIYNRPEEDKREGLIPVVVNREYWGFSMNNIITYAQVAFDRVEPVGPLHYILFEDGRVIMVSQLNLLCSVPSYFKEMIPNNAVFITEVEYRQIRYTKSQNSVAPYNTVCPQPLLNFLLEKYHFAK